MMVKLGQVDMLLFRCSMFTNRHRSIGTIIQRCDRAHVGDGIRGTSELSTESRVAVFHFPRRPSRVVMYIIVAIIVTS